MGSLFFGSIWGIYWCFKPFLILTRCRRIWYLPASIRQKKIDLIRLLLIFSFSEVWVFFCTWKYDRSNNSEMWDVTCYYGYRDLYHENSLGPLYLCYTEWTVWIAHCLQSTSVFSLRIVSLAFSLAAETAWPLLCSCLPVLLVIKLCCFEGQPWTT